MHPSFMKQVARPHKKNETKENVISWRYGGSNPRPFTIHICYGIFFPVVFYVTCVIIQIVSNAEISMYYGNNETYTKLLESPMSLNKI